MKEIRILFLQTKMSSNNLSLYLRSYFYNPKDLEVQLVVDTICIYNNFI